MSGTSDQIPGSPPVVFTIGHSTQTADALIALLRASGVTQIADVRRFPASRRHPQFAREALASALAAAGIAYEWLPELGGRRAPRPDSPNTGWRNPGFRGYADYMSTEPFQLGIARLMELARAEATALMCAEQAWQQCHRGLIADYLKAAGWEVVHILPRGQTEPHPWTEPAQIVDGALTYAPQSSQGPDSQGALTTRPPRSRRGRSTRSHGRRAR
jgi:uncharacterized protein (DUF488 family)